MKQSRFLEELARATQDLPAPLAAVAREQMARHWDLVKAWSTRVNLTAVLDDEEAVYRHYRDSLEALPWLSSKATAIDFGSGAGFPGIPLAIAAPTIAFTLLEPRRKRASFLEVAVARLGLENTRVRCAASSDVPDQRYEIGLTRATFSEPEAIAGCLSWLASGAPLVVFRSQPSGTASTDVHSYRVGGVDRILEIWSAAR